MIANTPNVFRWTVCLKPALLRGEAPNVLGDQFLRALAARGYKCDVPVPMLVGRDPDAVRLIYPDVKSHPGPRRERVYRNNVGMWLVVDVASTHGSVADLTRVKRLFRASIQGQHGEFDGNHLVHIPDTSRERALLLLLAGAVAHGSR